MPKIREVTGRTKMMIYCQSTACRSRVRAVSRIVNFGLRKLGYQAKPLNYYETKRVT